MEHQTRAGQRNGNLPFIRSGNDVRRLSQTGTIRLRSNDGTIMDRIWRHAHLRTLFAAFPHFDLRRMVRYLSGVQQIQIAPTFPLTTWQRAATAVTSGRAALCPPVMSDVMRRALNARPVMTVCTCA
jgi:hypothetical protein